MHPSIPSQLCRFTLRPSVTLALVLCGGGAWASIPQHHPHRHDARHLSGLPSGELRLRSDEALVIDELSAAVLLAKHADLAHPIASITKLMTALVVLEAAQPLDEVIAITEADENLDRPSSSRLTRGTELSRADLLHLALMASENRAAHALARSYPGGLAACIGAMNAKAQALGMISTHYVEPTGLSSLNVSSPQDLSKLVSVAALVPTIQEYSTDSHYSVTVGRHQVAFHTTDRLVSRPGWEIVLQKTGYIVEAGRCLVMKAIIDGRAVVIILMNSTGTQTRLADAERIKTWLGSRALTAGSL
jgi:serine-type D-Ala-D-Ala endopeptidase (penicillin-binding protein 7)